MNCPEASTPSVQLVTLHGGPGTLRRTRRLTYPPNPTEPRSLKSPMMTPRLQAGAGPPNPPRVAPLGGTLTLDYMAAVPWDRCCLRPSGRQGLGALASRPRRGFPSPVTSPFTKKSRRDLWLSGWLGTLQTAWSTHALIQIMAVPLPGNPNESRGRAHGPEGEGAARVPLHTAARGRVAARTRWG